MLINTEELNESILRAFGPWPTNQLIALDSAKRRIDHSTPLRMRYNHVGGRGLRSTGGDNCCRFARFARPRRVLSAYSPLCRIPEVSMHLQRIVRNIEIKRRVRAGEQYCARYIGTSRRSSPVALRHG